MAKRRSQFGNKKERSKLRKALFEKQNGCCKSCGEVIWFVDEMDAESFLKANPTCHRADLNTRHPSLHAGEAGPELWCQWCKTNTPDDGNAVIRKPLRIRLIEGGIMEAVGSNGRWMRVPEAAADEIQRCHERLEIDRIFKLGGEREDVPLEERLSMPDGIECRDATISLIEAERE